MKILQIHTKMVSGGIEAIVCGLANEMSKTNDVTVCTIFKPTEKDVFYYKLSSKINKITIGKSDFGFSIKEIFKIYYIIKAGNFDVVHVHGCFQYYFLAMILLHNKTRFFYTIHSDARKENQFWDWKLIMLKRFMFKNKWVIPVTISDESQKSFLELYSCYSELIYNGTPKIQCDNKPNIIDELKVNSETQVFVHAGRISKPKNQLVLCKVFQKLISQGYDVVLVIVGYPEEIDIYEKMKLYLSERIIYLGERNDIPFLFARADAFCLPSIWEGLPVTLLEALSVGCIPICSPVGGIVNVIKSEDNGILSKDSTEEEYYKAMSTFLSLSVESRKKMSESALKTFEKYDIKYCANNYLKKYNVYLNK